MAPSTSLRLIEEPFTSAARLSERRLEALVPHAVRLLDNIIDVSRYPLPPQEKEAKAKRRIGLGVTGLADALILCGKHYGSEEGRDLAESWMQRIAHAAYAASVELAKEKGAFPLFEAAEFLRRPFPSSLPPALQEEIREARHKERGPDLHCSHGHDFAAGGQRVERDRAGLRFRIPAPHSRAGRRAPLRNRGGSCGAALPRNDTAPAPLPDAFVTAHQLAPQEHLLMQAALQHFVDASISKTVNCPEDMAFEDFEALYLDAYRLGLKGCTAYRPNPVTGEVLSAARPASADAMQPALPLPLPLRKRATLQALCRQPAMPSYPASPTS